MGWKSTLKITRQQALDALQGRLLAATNEELGNAMESLGFGDRPELNYHGHNFIVDDTPESERETYERLKKKFGD